MGHMYKVVMKCPNGDTDELDEVFESEPEATAFGQDQCNAYATGGEVAGLSEGIDDDDDEDEADLEVIEGTDADDSGERRGR